MRLALAVSLFVCACHASETDESAEIPGGAACVAGEIRLEDGSCLQAGFQPDGCPAGERAVDGACVAAGIQDNGCPAGEVSRADGGCEPAGIPDGACAAGFESDGENGCRAVLPAEACPPGMIAVPGDNTCREIMDCGSGTWGDIVPDSTTQFVDAAYAGNDSDGTATKPWTTIGDAIDAAAPHAMIAVAAGTYPEYVLIEDRPLRLLGRCPSMVDIVGTADHSAALVVWSGADGTQLKGLGFTGESAGVAVSGSVVHAESLWIHDTASVGFAVTSNAGVGDVDVENVLIENASWYGVYAGGSTATLEGAAIRDTRQLSGQPSSGYGFLSVEQVGPATLTLRTSLVERNQELGGFADASDVVLDGVVVRDTVASPNSPIWGGVGVFARGMPQLPAALDVEGSIIEHNNRLGVSVWGARATLAHSVVRDTLEASVGRGIEVSNFDTARSSLTLRASVVDRNVDMGVVVIGSDADIQATLVRGTRPGAGFPNDVATGMGILVGGHIDTAQPANATILGSHVADNHAIGIGFVGGAGSIEGTRVAGTTQPPGGGAPGGGVFARYGLGRSNITLQACDLDHNDDYGIGVFGSDVTIEATMVRDSLPAFGPDLGRGMEIEDEPMFGERASVVVRTSIFERNHAVGISAFGADVAVEGTSIRDTAGVGFFASSDPLTFDPSALTLRWSAIERNRTAGFAFWGSTAEVASTRISDIAPQIDPAGLGDGIDAVHDGVREAQLTVTSSRIERVARAGVASFSSHVRLGASLLECNLIALNGESGTEVASTFEDLSGNSCGCADQRDVCKVLSQTLQPPQPIAPGS